MRRGLGLAHTWLCRDERGGSLPDEVGSSPHRWREEERKDDEDGRMIIKNLLLALLCSD